MDAIICFHKSQADYRGGVSSSGGCLLFCAEDNPLVAENFSSPLKSEDEEEQSEKGMFEDFNDGDPDVTSEMTSQRTMFHFFARKGKLSQFILSPASHPTKFFFQI